MMEQTSLPLAEELPRESCDDAGRLLCRHHRQPIRASGAPCPACWTEARGMFGPLLEADEGMS